MQSTESKPDDLDPVDKASLESFPTSDPPARFGMGSGPVDVSARRECASWAWAV